MKKQYYRLDILLENANEARRGFVAQVFAETEQEALGIVELPPELDR